ncbi:MAG: TonB-dependent receptor [Sphingobacteriales bacterium]|nr:MAG: TonB-dependent receptor [Sphingobacteriales bacterium]
MRQVSKFLASLKLLNFNVEKMRNRFLLIGLLVMLCSTFGFSQTQDAFLSGRVVDDNKEPLGAATLFLMQNGVRKAAKYSDYDGKFLLGPVSPGTYDLTVKYVGYPDQEVRGIQLRGDKTVNMPSDIVMSIPDTGTGNQKVVIITQFRDKSLNRDETTQERTMGSKEFRSLATRGINSAVATSSGVIATDKGISGKGSRYNANIYYIDGIKVFGTPTIPQIAVDQISTITGGVPAEYGDVTGTIVNITTKGPSAKFFGGLEAVTSQFLDPYGYNLIEGSVGGPLLTKNKGTQDLKSILGFFAAGNLTYNNVYDPPAIDVYRLKQEKLDQLKRNPISASPLGQGFVSNAEYITKNDLERTRVRPNTQQLNYSFSGKLDFQPTDAVNITAGGSLDRNNRNEYIYSYSMFNYENNPERLDDNYRAFIRYRQNFKITDTASLIKNAYYTIQADYSNTTYKRWDENLKDENPFSYGYIGQFNKVTKPRYTRQTRTVNGKEVTTNYFDGYTDESVSFTPGDVNKVTQNYTQSFFDLVGGDVQSTNDILQKGGLINGRTPGNVYSLWSGVGDVFGNIEKRQQEQYSLNASGAVTLGKNTGSMHALKFGIQYEERVERGHFVQGAPGLWNLARQLTNTHLQLDTLNPMAVYDEDGNFTDTVNYRYKSVNQSTFDKNFRQHLIDKGYRDNTGRLIDDQSFINIDQYGPEEFNLNMFSADELLNNGNSYVNYWGYDYLGKKTKGKTNVANFLDPQKRSVGAYNPIYVAGYIQDKFEFKDIIVRLGVRVDRFDANQLVLRDPYSLYPVRTAGEVSTINQQSISHPGNIGSDYVVYVDNAFAPTEVVGYRNGSTWYDASGAEIADPSIIAARTKSGTIQPYLVNQENVSKESEMKISKESFKDYVPQVNVMPRVSFSFPISTTAAFFANYDVLTQRPRSGNISTLDDYYYLKARATQTISNPALRPEKRTNYEIGFKQIIGKNSAISLQAFYGEIKDLIQRVQINQAYPQTYTTLGNIDFGTVKGLTAGYDFKRVGSSGIQLNLNYTLQFANGTGSDDASGQNLVNSGQPNLRTPFPLDYDVRNQLVGVIDYRFGDGDDYAGPKGKAQNFFANMGMNLVLNARSGTPYTQQSNLTQGEGVVLGVANRSAITGGINTARLPWQFRADGRIDKDFFLKSKKENARNTTYVNLYLAVVNILDAKNIVSVYRYTGLANDDGYLNSVQGQREASLAVNEEAFLDQYSIKANNPDNYTQPRTIRLGASINF